MNENDNDSHLDLQVEIKNICDDCKEEICDTDNSMIKEEIKKEINDNFSCGMYRSQMTKIFQVLR